MGNPKKTPNEQRNNRIVKVRLSEREKKIIKEAADITDQSMSAYLRNAGLSFNKPISLFDDDKFTALLKLNDDLLRLGNLQKIWLKDKNKFADVSTINIYKVLEDTEAVSTMMREMMTEIRDKRKGKFQ